MPYVFSLSKIADGNLAKDVTERYNNANLKHKCTHCKHQEPWSGLDLNKKKGYAIMCAIVSGLLFLTPAGTIVKYGNILTLLPLLVVFSIPTLLFVSRTTIIPEW